MLNLLACLTRSGTGAAALAGRVLGDRMAVAGIKSTTTEILSGGGEPEARGWYQLALKKPCQAPLAGPGTGLKGGCRCRCSPVALRWRRR